MPAGPMSDIVENADDALIERTMRDKHHLLYSPAIFSWS